MLLFDWVVVVVVAITPFEVCTRIVVVADGTGKMHTSDAVVCDTGVQSTNRSSSLIFIITLRAPQWSPSINIGVLSRNVFVVIADELLKKYCVGSMDGRDAD